MTTGEEGMVDEVFDSIWRTLRAERNRTEIECEAFADFANRIADLQLSNAPTAWAWEHGNSQETSGAVALQSKPMAGPSTADELATIRRAYEETVMNIPFYDAEYGDPYEESIREEFGPDVMTALTQANCFSTIAKEVLLTKVEHARAEREVLIETCERERESVDEAATLLQPIDDELRSFESIPFDDREFDALEAHRARLLTIEDKCEQAAATRQVAINQHRTEYSLPVDTPDICVYLYKEFETAYPILSLCSDLARRIVNCRRQVERAMSTCS